MITYPYSAEASGMVEAPADVVFDFLDDQENLSAHMSKPSGMMLGSTMKIEMEPAQPKRVGSRFGLVGRIFGIPLRVSEVVTSRAPPTSKAWETTAEPTLWVIGAYRMGFELAGRASRSKLRVHIAFARPSGLLGALLGAAFGAAYARWCTRRMVNDAIGHFGRRAAQAT
mgnify:CR=1 FL=1